MKTLLALLLMLGCAGMAMADVPMDVPQDHWAYEAVKDLANEGLVLGYPDGSFLGDRRLSRYEFATIVKRVLDNVDQETMTLKSNFVAPTTAAAAATTQVPQITKADIENINKLVNEFKVELAVIGTRLDKVEATVEELNTRLESIDATVNDPEGALQATKDEVGKMKKVAVSGYIQSRYQSFDVANEDNSENATASNKAYDTFLVRRARIKVTAKPTSRSTAVIQLDLGKNAVSVKDTYLQYALGENAAISPSFTVGQFNWPFGYEVPYSSSRRETPERALVFRRLFPGERDQGAKLAGAEDKSFYWQLAAFNGTGTEKGAFTDANDAKDVVGNAKWSLGIMDVGVSGYWGEGAWKTFNDYATYLKDIRKIRYGADVQVYLNNVTLKAEYVRGKGIDVASSDWDQNDWVDGYYAQINYNLSVKDTLCARYSSMSDDPVKPKYGRRSAVDVGWLRWLDSNSRFKLFYRFNNEELEQFYNDGLVAEWLVTY